MFHSLMQPVLPEMTTFRPLSPAGWDTVLHAHSFLHSQGLLESLSVEEKLWCMHTCHVPHKPSQCPFYVQCNAATGAAVIPTIGQAT